MMSHRSLLIALLIAAPTVATAQGMGGGGMGRRGGRRGGGGGDSASAAMNPAAARDSLEALGFAGLVLRHRSALQLTDSQVVVLTGLQGEFKVQSATARQQLDSLRAANAQFVQEVVASHDTLTSAQRDTVIKRREMIASVLANLRDIEQQARQHTLAILTPTQQQQAQALETQAEQGRPRRGGFGGGRSEEGTGGRGSPPF